MQEAFAMFRKGDIVEAAQRMKGIPMILRRDILLQYINETRISVYFITRPWAAGQTWAQMMSSYEEIEERGPITDLYPFAIAASAEKCDLSTVLLIETKPIIWKGVQDWATKTTCAQAEPRALILAMEMTPTQYSKITIMASSDVRSQRLKTRDKTDQISNEKEHQRYVLKSWQRR